MHTAALPLAPLVLFPDADGFEPRRHTGGENGFFRVKFGALNLEQRCAWATIKDFTAPERGNQYRCFEDGSNCKAA